MNYIVRNKEQLFTFSSFALITILYFIFSLDEKVYLGLIGTVATLYFGSLKHRIENDKLFKELFQEFNSRYDHRFNDLINNLKYDTEKELTPDDKNLIIDYLNLCSEEYLWRSKNRIPKEVWEAWKAGIKENLKVKQIESIYKQETLTKYGIRSFYGLVDELNR